MECRTTTTHTHTVVFCEWDICEHLRQEFVQTAELPLYVQKLVDRWYVAAFIIMM